MQGKVPLLSPSRAHSRRLLTVSLSAKLAEAVSELVGAAYAVRIEPKAHRGAEMLVEFFPRPPEHTLKIALGEETIELPLPPGVVDEPTS